MSTLKNKIISLIKENGFITIDRFMEICFLDEEHGYYRKKQPLGSEGDFTTAPEISQLFGEMIGLFLINWISQNLPDTEFEIVELGAGKGTLMNDLLRTLKKFPQIYEKAKINIIDINEPLIKHQKKLLNKYDIKIEWLSAIEEIKTLKPVIFLANEFFDALPIKQYLFKDNKWHERVIKHNNDLYFSSIPSDIEFSGNPKESDIKEISPETIAGAENISDLISLNKGLSIIFDYGYSQNSFGDTLQSLYKNKYNPIFENIGISDITYHVDFPSLKNIFETKGLSCFLQTQREFLLATNIEKRAEMLIINKDSTTKKSILEGMERLVSPKEMGVLFKCLIAEKA